MNSMSHIDLRTKAVQGRQRRILLVEDDPHWQTIISRTLKTVDGRIDLKCVPTVGQAKELLNSNSNYDLIIADHYLKDDTTGLDLWKECRTLRSRTPFMVVSGMSQSEFTSLLDINSESPLYMAKPFEIESLRSMLKWQLGMPIGVATETTTLNPIVKMMMLAALLMISAVFYLTFPSMPESSPKTSRQFDVSTVVTSELKARVHEIAGRPNAADVILKR